MTDGRVTVDVEGEEVELPPERAYSLGKRLIDDAVGLALEQPDSLRGHADNARDGDDDGDDARTDPPQPFDEVLDMAVDETLDEMTGREDYSYEDVRDAVEKLRSRLGAVDPVRNGLVWWSDGPRLTLGTGRTVRPVLHGFRDDSEWIASEIWVGDRALYGPEVDDERCYLSFETVEQHPGVMDDGVDVTVKDRDTTVVETVNGSYGAGDAEYLLEHDDWRAHLEASVQADSAWDAGDVLDSVRYLLAGSDAGGPRYVYDEPCDWCPENINATTRTAHVGDIYYACRSHYQKAKDWLSGEDTEGGPE